MDHQSRCECHRCTFSNAAYDFIEEAGPELFLDELGAYVMSALSLHDDIEIPTATATFLTRLRMSCDCMIFNNTERRADESVH